jgi:hypothetical protein
MVSRVVVAMLLIAATNAVASAQSSPLWHEQKIKNYLPP